MNHYIYIIQCADNSLYTGYTNDVQSRIQTHNQGKGAKYTRSRLPVTLLYTEMLKNKSEAMQREYEIKQFSRQQKWILINFQAEQFLPQNKYDTTSIQKLDSLLPIEINKIAFELLSWIQDLNWPIASPMSSFIIKKQKVFIPAIKKALLAEQEDAIWKHVIITRLFPYFHAQTLNKLKPTIKRIKLHPTIAEIDESVDEAITQY